MTGATFTGEIAALAARQQTVALMDRHGCHMPAQSDPELLRALGQLAGGWFSAPETPEGSGHCNASGKLVARERLELSTPRL